MDRQKTSIRHEVMMIQMITDFRTTGSWPWYKINFTQVTYYIISEANY